METTIRTQRRSIVANLFVIALLIGFFIFNIVSKIFKLSDEGLSIEFRALIAVFSFYFIFYEILSNKLKSLIVRVYRLFLLFWLIYGIRIIFDLFIDPIKLYEDKSAFYYIQFAFGVCLFPSLALIYVLRRYQLNYDFILKWTYGLLYIVLLISIYYRSASGIVGRTIGQINVGIISYGHYATTLCLLSVYIILSQKKSFLLTATLVSGILFGFFGIVISASKSPLIALFIVSSVFIFFWHGRIKSFIILTLLGIILSLFFLENLYFLSNYFESGFIERVLYTAEIESDEVRESLLKAASFDFSQNPIFGNAFLIQNHEFSGSYPHNSVVEAFMATGVLGGIIFIFLILKGIQKAIYLIKSKSSFAWISLIFLQHLVLGIFSGNLYSSNLFWLTLVIIFSFDTSNISSLKIKA